MKSATLDLGSIRITWLHGGDFELDGGTMFGAVPKVLWQKKMAADENNYIRMGNDPLLVQTGDAVVLIDSGLGNKLGAKQQEIFRVRSPWSLPEELATLGLSREDVSHVILTHCDFDHAGGIVMVNGQGLPELTFPRARHIIQEREWHDVLHPNSRSAHTYWPDNFAGLAASGLLDLVDGAAEIVPGIAVDLTGGHTRGHQLVTMQGTAGCAVHLGDVLPLPSHTNPLWIMAYDNYPLEIIEKKEELLPRFREAGCWFTFYHDPATRACRLDEKGKVAERI